MAYTITNSDSSRTITVQDTTVDSTYSLKLIGRNVSGYGQYFVENTVRHLENFASTVQPSGEKLIGQLWFDKSENIFKYWTGSAWKRSTNIIVGSAPTTPLSGDAYFNTNNQKLYIYNGSAFQPSSYAGEVSDAFNGITGVGQPANYGTKLRNIFLVDTSDNPKPVIALVYVSDGNVNSGATNTDDGKETIMAIISDHEEFTAKNVSSITESESINYYNELQTTGGIGLTIKPGLNLRSEYAATAVALADRAYRSDATYTLNLGSVGSDGANISTTEVIHTGRDYVPSTGNAFDLGEDGKAFAGLYTNLIVLGSGGASELQANGTVSIGNASSRIDSIYSKDIDVSGNVTFSSGVQNIGTSVSPVENFYAANAFVSSKVQIGTGGTAYDLPIVDGLANYALITDGAGTVSFGAVPLTTTQMIAGAGLTGGGTLAADRTFNVGTGAYIIVNADSIEVDATSAATASKIVARDGSGNFAANEITFTDLNDGSIAINQFDNDAILTANSSTRLATQQATKIYIDTSNTQMQAYVDALVTAQDLDFQGDTGGALNIDLDSETLTIAGGNNITTAGSGNQITVNLDTALTGMVSASFSGAVSGGSLTDSTATLSSGALSGATTGTFSGNVSAGNVSATLFTGNLLGDVTGSISGANVEFSTGLTDGIITITGFVDEDNMSSDSATLVPTQQSVKAYVDSQVTAQDLDFQGDSGGALSIDLDSETLDIAGGFNINTVGSGNQITVNLDTALTGMVSADFSGTVQYGSLSDGIITITGFVDEDNMASDSATLVPTQQSVKAYVDSQVTAQDLDFQGDTGGALSIDLDSETLDIAGGNNITTAGSGNQITVNLDTALTGMVSASFSGNVDATYFNGTATSAQYADLAENYVADQSYDEGTVVVLGGSHEVTTDGKENNPAVAGVVSTNPAYLMNADCEGDHIVAVALRGRVPVKVVGPVKKGDILVHSSTPGHAMAAPFNGYHVTGPCVIGKAISAKADLGEGVVEALI